MNIARGFWAMALAGIAITVGGSHQARAQQAPGSYYGYASHQAPAPSAQANYTCVPPGPGCTPEQYGCHVTVCPCPCQRTPGCIPGIPDIHVPSCQNPCTVISELPPIQRPVTYDIYRNCYIPIRIEYKHTPADITPVNLNVKWREIHFLCGPDGKPLSSPQAAAVLKELQEQLAAGGAAGASGGPSASNAPSPSPNAGNPSPSPASAVPTASSVPAPTTATATAAADAPRKQWIWITNRQAYGFGYIGQDGFAVIDAGTMRQAPPTQMTSGTSTLTASAGN